MNEAIRELQHLPAQESPSTVRIVVLSEKSIDRVSRLIRNGDGYHFEAWTLGDESIAARFPVSEAFLRRLLADRDLKLMLGVQ